MHGHHLQVCFTETLGTKFDCFHYVGQRYVVVGPLEELVQQLGLETVCGHVLAQYASVGQPLVRRTRLSLSHLLLLLVECRLYSGVKISLFKVRSVSQHSYECVPVRALLAKPESVVYCLSDLVEMS